MSVRVTTLGNGLRVATDAMGHLETTALGVWVDAGARNESREINGVSHMLEHMAFKGTTSRTAQQIAEQIEAVGGHLNAYTSRENTAYFARVLKEDVPLAADILADILQHSVFDEGELTRERTVIIQEIGQTEDTPDDLIFDHFQDRAFPDHPLGRSILGSVERVNAMTRADLVNYMDAHYSGPSMVLAAAGRIEHDRLVELAERAFAGIADAVADRREPARYRGGDYREARELEQIHFALGFSGVAHTDPDYFAVQLLTTLLGGGMSSRLFQEVREKRGLAYAVSAFASSYLDGGLFGVYAGTGEGEIGELVPVVCDEVNKVAHTLTGGEVDRARAQLKAGMLMALESPSSRCEQLARQLLIFGRPIPVAEIVNKIDAVDEAQIRRVARRLVTAGAPVVAAIGPIARLESYAKVAARFA